MPTAQSIVDFVTAWREANVAASTGYSQRSSCDPLRCGASARDCLWIYLNSWDAYEHRAP
jgi:hypothetical protein